MKEHPFTRGVENAVENLSLARIALINKGNQDIAEYDFGITLQSNNRVVDFTMSEPDRHHTMKVLVPADVEQVSNLDFTLTPLNRGDEYGVDIYFTYDENPGEIKLSSAHSAVLTKLSESIRGELSERFEKIFRSLFFLFIITAVLEALLGGFSSY